VVLIFFLTKLIFYVQIGCIRFPKYIIFKQSPKGYDGCVYKQTNKLLGIINTRKHNVLETGFISVLRRRDGDTYCVGSLRKS
jgi:hypothetical protein